MDRATGSTVIETAAGSTATREALALVWGENAKQAKVAVESLTHALWPYWYRFRVTEVRQLPLAGSCPLECQAPTVLASLWRERWAWVLVAPGSDLAAVVSCT